jgi:hypothetical protein
MPRVSVVAQTTAAITHNLQLRLVPVKSGRGSVGPARHPERERDGRSPFRFHRLQDLSFVIA